MIITILKSIEKKISKLEEQASSHQNYQTLYPKINAMYRNEQ
jgi:chromosome segregation ATPase